MLFLKPQYIVSEILQNRGAFMSFQIIGDSCCDYPYLEPDYPWLKRVPLTIELEGVTYVDDETLSSSMLVEKMAASLFAPKSACPSPGNYFAAYDCGADDIYVVTLSDKLSGSYNSAVVAADMFKTEYPERNIFVFSSKSAASGQIAVCEKIYEMALSGMDYAQVVRKTLEFITTMGTYFVLDNLEVFRKNGRLNHLQSIVTGALRLKLVMGGDEAGNICVRGKAMSYDRAVIKMAELIAARLEGIDLSGRILYITQCLCPDRARRARDEIMKRTGFMDCKIFKAGGISTIYANSGGLVVAY
jgi:DegV family protein with EDD domain